MATTTEVVAAVAEAVAAAGGPARFEEVQALASPVEGAEAVVGEASPVHDQEDDQDEALGEEEEEKEEEKEQGQAKSQAKAKAKGKAKGKGKAKAGTAVQAKEKAKGKAKEKGTAQAGAGCYGTAQADAEAEATTWAEANEAPAVVLDAPPVIPDIARCNRCKQECPLDNRVPVSRKCAGTFRCRLCNSKGTQLTRLTSWPEWSVKMKDFSAEEKAAFWASTHSADGTKALQQLLCERMSTRSVETKSATTTGGYYPLGWYEKQGFPTEAIVEKCVDKREHLVYGTVYRVPIDHVSSGATEERSRERTYERWSGSGAAGASSSSQVPGVGKVLAIEDGETDTADRKRKAATAAAADYAKAAKRQKAEATKVLSKLATVVTALKGALGHKDRLGKGRGWSACLLVSFCHTVKQTDRQTDR